MHKLIITLLILLCTCNVGAWKITPHRDAAGSGGYPFSLYTPDQAEKGDSLLPLIVFLHGASLAGNDLSRVERYGTLNAIHKGLNLPAYILAPQTKRSWNPEVVMKNVEWAERNCKIDTTRIYVLGMSLGGFGTMDFAATYPSKVAAAMAICGGATKPVDPLAEVPLWILHGTADRPVPIRQSERVAERINEINKGERLIYTRLPGVDHGQPARFFYLHEVYDWLFEHRTTDKGRPINRKYTLDKSSLQRAYRDLPGHGRRIR